MLQLCIIINFSTFQMNANCVWYLIMAQWKYKDHIECGKNVNLQIDGNAPVDTVRRIQRVDT